MLKLAHLPSTVRQLLVCKDLPCLQCCPQTTANFNVVYQYFFIACNGLSKKIHYVLESIHTYTYNIIIRNALI